MRKLATFRIITDISPIEGADRIEVATVGGWKVVVAKDVGHKVGDLVVYCEVDSFLPIKPKYEFLRKSSYRKLADGSEGFRLRTIKLRGQISQGLILPVNELEELKDRTYDLNQDLSELLGITKWDPPLPAELSGTAIGYIPSEIEKTDEERIQNLVDEYPDILTKEYYSAEKLDGSSATFFLKDGEFGVCSRNLQLQESDTNSFWKVARKLDIEQKMRDSELQNFAIQGELIGEGIQKNPYRLKGQTVRFFSVYDINRQCKFKFHRFEEIISDLGLETVPILNRYIKLPEDMNELIKMSDGKSILNLNARREGIVYRSLDGEYSFKVISNEFLVKEKD